MYYTKVKKVYRNLKVLFVSFLMFSCKHEAGVVSPVDPLAPLPLCDSTTITFSYDVMPFINSTCAVPGCHDNKGPAAGIDLSTYEAIMKSKVGIKNIVKPGDALNSKICRVLYLLDLIPMPPPFNYPIPAKGRDNIVKWVQQGAKNNEPCEIKADTTQFSFRRQIGPMINKYCTGCHYGPYNSGNILLTNYREIKSVVDSNKLIESFTGDNGVSKMPTGVVSLQPYEIIQVRKWIENGALND